MVALTHWGQDKMTTTWANDIFTMQFRQWKCLNFEIKSPNFLPKGPIGTKPSLVQVMVWRRIGDKPLHELMMTMFSDACMRHLASMSDRNSILELTNSRGITWFPQWQFLFWSDVRLYDLQLFCTPMMYTWCCNSVMCQPNLINIDRSKLDRLYQYNSLYVWGRKILIIEAIANGSKLRNPKDLVCVYVYVRVCGRVSVDLLVPLYAWLDP